MISHIEYAQLSIEIRDFMPCYYTIYCIKYIHKKNIIFIIFTEKKESILYIVSQINHVDYEIFRTYIFVIFNKHALGNETNLYKYT